MFCGQLNSCVTTGKKCFMVFYFIICIVSDLEYSGSTQNILAFSFKKCVNYNSSLKNASTCFEGAQRKPKNSQLLWVEMALFSKKASLEIEKHS